MSVFSMIKRGHKAAKEHAAKQAEKERKEQEKTPYKHVPRHAAIDALSGGPASFRDGDKQRIVEQNRRRSAMTASGVGMGGMMTPVHMGMQRTNSSLSYVSYPSAYASPVVQMPRAYSYTGVSPGWSHQGGEMAYSPIDMVTSKGKEVERVMIDSGRGSRSSSKGSHRRMPMDGRGGSGEGSGSPTGSSSGSSSSQDDLEMRPAKQTSSSSPNAAAAKAPRPMSEAPDYFYHRLHPSSHSRRTSDPSQNLQYYPPQTRNPYAQYGPRPGPPSRANSNGAISEGVPPVPALPPMQLGSTLTAQPVASPASSTSSVTMVPAASTNSLAAKVATSVVEVAPQKFEGPLSADPIVLAGQPTPAPAPASAQDRRSRRLSKPTRFTELETIDSSISNLSATLDFGFSSKETAQVSRTYISSSPTFSEATPTPTTPTSLQEPIAPPPKKGKLSKSGRGSAPKSAPQIAPAAPKAKKTHRWSLRSAKTTAVAV